jgi:hypothetical protein
VQEARLASSPPVKRRGMLTTRLQMQYTTEEKKKGMHKGIPILPLGLLYKPRLKSAVVKECSIMKLT